MPAPDPWVRAAQEIPLARRHLDDLAAKAVAAFEAREAELADQVPQILVMHTGAMISAVLLLVFAYLLLLPLGTLRSRRHDGRGVSTTRRSPHERVG